MSNFKHGHQTPESYELGSQSPVGGAENRASTVTSDTASDAKVNSKATSNEQELKMMGALKWYQWHYKYDDARKWSQKYKLFVSFGAILSFFFM